MKGKSHITNYLIITLIIIIPLACVLLSLLPVEVQRSLMLQTGEWNPLTFFTSIFIHINQDHLSGNIASFLIISILLYLVNWKAGSTHMLLTLMLLTIFLIPFTYNISFNFYTTFIIRESFISCGLSTAVAGLLGLTIPSLRVFLTKTVQNNFTLNYFALSLILLTISVITLSRILEVICMIIFITTLACSIILLLKTHQPITRLFKKDLYSKLIILATLLTLTVYYLLVYFFFPANIVTVEGSIIDVVGHLTGLFSGIVIGYIYVEL